MNLVNKFYKIFVIIIFMNRFDCIDPLDYRYIPRDRELFVNLRKLSDSDVYKKIEVIVCEVVIPRLSSLENTLMDFASKTEDVTTAKRVDGRQYDLMGVDEIFIGYRNRLHRRVNHLLNINLDFNGNQTDVADKISDLTYYLTCILSIEANIATDIRHLFRSEIDEFTFAKYEDGRIGSSTMPNKVNPVEFENVVSLWKRFHTTLTSAILGQVVEHQGDSTNEEIPYQTLKLTVATAYNTLSLEKALKNLVVKDRPI